MKKIVFKLIPYTLAFVLGLYVIEILAGIISALSEFKFQFGNHVNEVLLNGIQHPFANIHAYVQQKNPIMILGALIILMYLFYFAMKRRSKNQDWQTADEQTHGSATWGDSKELINDGHYFKIKTKEIQNEFDKSIDKKILAQIKEERG